MSADHLFAVLVYLAVPPTLLYPVIYGLTCRWWTSWIGRSLLIKAIGVHILISFSALYHFFGPHYFGRDVIRITGMVIVCIGFYAALIALLQVKLEARRNRKPGETMWRHADV